MNKSKRKSITSAILKYVLVIVVLYFVYIQLEKNWEDLILKEWKIDFLFLVFSILTHLLTLLLLSYIWCILIKSFGHDIKIRHGFKVAYISNLGRYIPGKIWQVFGMVYVAKKLGLKVYSERGGVAGLAG